MESPELEGTLRDRQSNSMGVHRHPSNPSLRALSKSSLSCGSLGGGTIPWGEPGQCPSTLEGKNLYQTSNPRPPLTQLQPLP